MKHFAVFYAIAFLMSCIASTYIKFIRDSIHASLLYDFMPGVIGGAIALVLMPGIAVGLLSLVGRIFKKPLPLNVHIIIFSVLWVYIVYSQVDVAHFEQQISEYREQ